MARLAKVTVSYGRTVNLKNFHSLREEVSLELTPEPGDTKEAILEQAQAFVKAAVEESVTAKLAEIVQQQDAIFEAAKGLRG